MKVRSKELTNEQRMETLDALYTAAGTVHGRASMKLFLRDLLTESERIMLGRRILIARHLLTKSTFDEISVRLKVGHDTIQRVQHWLDDQFPGYEQAVRDMEKEFAKRKKKYSDKKEKSVNRRLYATSALYRLKKKYPMHFLLFPWPKLKD